MEGRPRSLIVILISSYALAILSAVHFAGAIYLLTSGITEVEFVVELALVILSVRLSNQFAVYYSLAEPWFPQTVLSFFYLGLQTLIARRYRRIRWHDPRTRSLNDACLILLAFVALVWLTAFALGLTIAIRSIDGLWAQINGRGWKSHDGSKFREAGFAGPLLAL